MSKFTSVPRGIFLAFALVVLVLALVPGEGTANIAFQEEWLPTAAAQAKECPDPDEICLEMCLVNPQNGNIIVQGVFDCFPPPP